MKSFISAVALVSIFFASLFFASTSLATVEPSSRLVAVGDIHGDAEGLRTILTGMKLIDKNSQWIGGDTHLVFLGDILDRGRTTRQTIDLILALQSQAQKAGGQVTTLMGNHELMLLQGDLRYFAKRDVGNYGEFAGADPSDLKATVMRAFDSNTKYGKWIDSLSAIMVVGRTLFMHAGIENWIRFHSIESVNQMIKRWMGYFRGLFPEPDPSTRWVIEKTGPLWTREAANGKLNPKQFHKMLKAAGYDRVIVGHTITAEKTSDALPVLSHPVYGQQLVMIDTGNSSAIGGQLSALEWIPGHKLKAYTFQRSAPPEGETSESLLFQDGDGVDPMPEESKK
jgi:hypothetical protein